MFEARLMDFVNMIIVAGGIGSIFHGFKMLTGLHKKSFVFDRVQPLIAACIGAVFYYFYMKIEPVGVCLAMGAFAGASASWGYSALKGLRDLVKEFMTSRVKGGQDE